MSTDKAPGLIHLRNREALSRFHERLAEHYRGQSFPDARTQELMDRGSELHWRARVQRNAIRKGYRQVLLDVALAAEAELLEMPAFLRRQV